MMLPKPKSQSVEIKREKEQVSELEYILLSYQLIFRVTSQCLLSSLSLRVSHGSSSSQDLWAPEVPGITVPPSHVLGTLGEGRALHVTSRSSLPSRGLHVFLMTCSECVSQYHLGCLQPRAEHVGVLWGHGEHDISRKVSVTAREMMG